uniref:Mating type MAT1-1 locus protein n=2 Tax=Morchella importuna TaxID=1174673 RepID=A0A2I4LR12_9PEZI|nr:mating type MAT1-1 locus protein [Morchella importuna]AVI60816.1 mating type protein MAT1-1-1 [Morchella importuna]
MSLRPVYLTGLVRENPPSESVMLMDAIKRTLCLRNATLGCALYLSKTHQYLLMQDRGGGIWVQHKDCRYIVPPPGGSVFQVQGRPLPFQRWLTLMHRLVRQNGRVGLDPKIPYKCAVQRLYGEHYKSNRPIVDEPLTKRSVLKALNPYIAHRTWISKFLGGLGFTQMLISALTKGVWQREKRKAMWSNIARLYTYHRDQGTLTSTLEDFIKAQLIENKQDPSPSSFLHNCGINLDDVRKRMTPTCIPPDAQIFAIGTVAPIEETYSGIQDIPNVHFQAPTVPDSTAMESAKTEPIIMSPISTICTVSKDYISSRARQRSRKTIARSELTGITPQDACQNALSPPALPTSQQSTSNQMLVDPPQDWNSMTPVTYNTNQLDPRLNFLPIKPLPGRLPAFDKTLREPGTYPEPEIYPEPDTYSESRHFQESQFYPQQIFSSGLKFCISPKSDVEPRTYTAPNIYPEPYTLRPENATSQVFHGIYNPQNMEIEEPFDFTKENTYFVSETYTSNSFPQPQSQTFQEFVN